MITNAFRNELQMHIMHTGNEVKILLKFKRFLHKLPVCGVGVVA